MRYGGYHTVRLPHRMKNCQEIGKDREVPKKKTEQTTFPLVIITHYKMIKCVTCKALKKKKKKKTV